MDAPVLAIVIPAHNEASRLAAVLGTLPAAIAGIAEVRVIVVDDGSTDGTDVVARKGGALTVRHTLNLGKGAALRTGCEAALRVKAELIVAMDADGQHLASDLPALLEPLQSDHADLVLAYREASGAMPALFKVGNAALNSVLRLMFGVAIRDSQCGLRAFTAAAYGKIRWEARDYSVESEMLVRMSRAHLRFAEVPIASHYADPYKGTQPIDGVRILGQLLRLRLRG